MTKTVTVQAQQRWDHCLETRKTESSLLNAVNELGQQGWELIDVLYYKDLKGVMSWTAFLKRPSLGQAAAPGQQAAVTANSAASQQVNGKAAEPQGFDLSGDEFQLKTE